MGTIILLVFFALLLLVIYGSPELQFFALLGGLVLFPDNLILLQHPTLTPYQIILAGFFITEVINFFDRFKKSLFTFPIKISFLIVFIVILVLSYKHGGIGYSTYEALRFFMDKYCGLLAAFICAYRCGEKKVLTLFIPILTIFCVCGLIEFLLNHNYLRALIYYAFPTPKDIGFGPEGITQGFESGSWRYRISITTKHPTALGNLLTVCFLFFLPYLKSELIKKNYVWGILGLILVTTFISGSRTALACIFVFTLWYIIIPHHLSFKIIFLALLLFAGEHFLTSAVEDFSKRGQGSSIALRQDQLLFSIASIANEPIFGNGFYYTQRTALATDNDGKLLYENKSEVGGLESIVFRVLIDQGIIGMFAVILIYMSIFFYFFVRRKRIPLYATQGYLITGATFFFLILSGEIGKNAEMCFIIIGLTMGLCSQKETCEEDNNVLANAK